MKIANRFPAFLLALLVFCFHPELAHATDVSGTISTPTTWTTAGSPYVVKGSITIQGGGSLTIEAGVQVQFDGAHSIIVGSSTTGNLIAQGTVASHVSFTKTAAFAGKWNCIQFANFATASSLNYCDFSDGGNSTATIYCASSSPQLSNLTITNSGSAGISLESASPSISNVSMEVTSGYDGITGVGAPSFSGNITLSAGAGYLINASASFTPTFSGLTVSSSGKLGNWPPDAWADFLASNPTVFGGPYEQEVSIFGTLSKSSTWGGQSWLSQIRLSSLVIAGSSNPVLTLAAGTNVKFTYSGTNIYVGAQTGGNKGDLVALGTAANPVNFASGNLPNKWGYIYFSSNSTALSKLDYCNLIDGGNSAAPIYCSNASPTLSNLTITNSGSAGIYLESASPFISNVAMGAASHGITGTGAPSFLGKLSLTTGTGYLINAASSFTPSFSGLTVSSSGKLGNWPANAWADFLASNPTVAGGPYEQEVSGSTLSKNSTWGGQSWLSLIRILGQIYIGAPDSSTIAVLTLAPGTTVRFSGGFSVGVPGVGAGTLIANGTSSAGGKISLLPATSGGSWSGITYSNLGNAVPQKLEHCIIESASLTKSDSTHLTLKNCEFRNYSNNYSIRILSGGATIEGLNVHDCYGGVEVQTNSGIVNVVGSTFANMPGSAIYSYGSQGLSLVEGSVFQGVDRGIYAGGTTAAVIYNCQFSNWNAAGIDFDTGCFPVVQECTFQGSGMALRFPADAVDLFSDPVSRNTLTSTGNLEIGVYGETLQQEAYWRPVSAVPYTLLGGLSYSKPFTILGGTTIRVGQNLGIFPNINPPPALYIQGTAAAPVLFTSALPVPAPGNWQAMSIGPGSSIEHATFEYQQGGLVLTNSSTIRNCTIRNSTGIGISQSGSSSAVSPSLIQDCVVEGHASHGISVSSHGKMDLVRAKITSNGGYGVKATANASGNDSFVSIRESNIFANATGGVLAEAYGHVDSAYCYWGDASGPSGSGPGSGNSISGAGAIEFNPWYTTEISSPFWISQPFVGPLKFPPGTGLTTFHAAFPLPADWQIKAFNSSNTKVLDWTGSGDGINVNWKGVQYFGSGLAPPPSGGGGGGGFSGGIGTWIVGGIQVYPEPIPRPPALPDGIYTFTMNAKDSANPSVQSTLKGMLELDSSILVANISSPEILGYIAAGTSVTVKGKATGSRFSSYVLDYGIGSEPASFTTIQSSTTAVLGGDLGTFTVPASSSGYLTLRLRVNDGTVVEAVDSFPVQLFSFSGLAATPAVFSPNGDGYQDSTIVSGTITWPADWTAEIFQNQTGPFWTLQGSGSQILVEWDGKDTAGASLPDGGYSIRITASPLDDPSLSLVQDVPVILGSSSAALQIVSPVANSMVSGTVPIVLSSSLSGSSGNLYRLEYGNDPDWQLICTSNNFFTPICNWATASVPGGDYSLKASLFLPDGSVFVDTIPVRVRHLNVTVADCVIDPVNGESTSITVLDGAGSDGNLLVEVYPAGSAYTTPSWEGYYSGYASTAPSWSGSVAFTGGQAVVAWNGKDNTGVPLAAGEYTCRAVLTYPNGDVAKFEEPSYLTPAIVNGYLSGLGVGVQQGASFDPYYGESTDVDFTLSQPAWITVVAPWTGYGGAVPKLFHEAGANIFWWDGRVYAQQALAFPGGATFFVGIKATRAPGTLIFLTNRSLTVDDFAVDPISIFPAFGQFSTISYSLSRQAKVTITAYDPVSYFYRTLINGELQAAGSHQFVWDGSDSSGSCPSGVGDFTIEFIAEDPSASSYRAIARRAIRLWR